MIPKNAMFVLRGVKPHAKMESDEGFVSTVRNWRCEQYFSHSEQDAAETMYADWLSAGVRHVTLTAVTWNGKFWRFNGEKYISLLSWERQQKAAA